MVFLWTNLHQIVCSIRGRINSSPVWIESGELIGRLNAVRCAHMYIFDRTNFWTVFVEPGANLLNCFHQGNKEICLSCVHFLLLPSTFLSVPGLSRKTAPSIIYNLPAHSKSSGFTFASGFNCQMLDYHDFHSSGEVQFFFDFQVVTKEDYFLLCRN